MANQIQYGIIPVSKSQEIHDFLVKHFFPNEPISRAFGLPINQVTRWFGMQIQECLKQNASIQAVDSSTGELLGVAINILVEKTLKRETDKGGDEKEGRGLLEILDPEKEAVMVKIAKFLGILNQVPDDFYKTGADSQGLVKTFNCIYLAVLPSCGGKGIGKRLIEESEKVARKQGSAAFLQVDTTSDFSYRIFHLHCGYEVIREIDLAPHIPGIHQIDGGAHKKGRILLKKL